MFNDQPILILTIDLGNDTKDEITIKENDSLAELAQQFCEKHSLSESVKSSIKAYLEDSMSSISTSSSFIKQNSSKENVGIRLYTTGMLKLQQKEKKIKAMQEQKIQLELEQTTFRPRINRSKSSKRRVKCTKTLRKYRELETKECTFAPKLSENSLKIAKNRDPAQVHVKLYNDNEIFTSNKQKLRDSYFNATCAFATSNLKGKVNLNDSIERLHRSKRSPAPRVRDQNETFYPATGRPPSAKRPIDVFHYLYSQRPIVTDRPLNLH